MNTAGQLIHLCVSFAALWTLNPLYGQRCFFICDEAEEAAQAARNKKTTTTVSLALSGVN